MLVRYSIRNSLVYLTVISTQETQEWSVPAWQGLKQVFRWDYPKHPQTCQVWCGQMRPPGLTRICQRPLLHLHDQWGQQRRRGKNPARTQGKICPGSFQVCLLVRELVTSIQFSFIHPKVIELKKALWLIIFEKAFQRDTSWQVDACGINIALEWRSTFKNRHFNYLVLVSISDECTALASNTR